VEAEATLRLIARLGSGVDPRAMTATPRAAGP
jgi:hypothetical protein